MSRAFFIGLGVMGFPVAGLLQQAGIPLKVFNRAESRSTRWKSKYQGEVAPSIAAGVKDADIVISCVSDDDALRQIAYGEEGVLQNLREGCVFVDHSTVSFDCVSEIHRAAAMRDVGFLDAPISGGQQGAQNGELTIMCGGREKHFDACLEVFDIYSKQATLIGPGGSGQLAKMVNQICIAGLLQGLAEGLHFAQCAGLDGEKVIGVISQGAAQSWQMVNRSKTMLEDEYDHGFAVDLMRKDLGICLAEGRKNGSQLPVTALVDQFFADLQSLGGGKWDTSSLLKRLSSTSSATLRDG